MRADGKGIRRGAAAWAIIGALLAAGPGLAAVVTEPSPGPVCSRAEDCLQRWQRAGANLVHLRAGFRQERHTSLLREPLVSAGRLEVEPPDRFELRVEEPEPWMLRVTRNGVRVGPPGEEEKVDAALASGPSLRVLTELLRGRVSSADFGITLLKDRPGTLRLVTKEMRFRDVISEIHVEFVGDLHLPQRVVIVESGGDRIDLRLVDVEIDEQRTPSGAQP